MRDPDRIPPASSIRSGLSSRTTVANRVLPPASGPGRMYQRMSFVCMIMTCFSCAAANEAVRNRRKMNTRTVWEIIAVNCTLLYRHLNTDVSWASDSRPGFLCGFDRLIDFAAMAGDDHIQLLLDFSQDPRRIHPWK